MLGVVVALRAEADSLSHEARPGRITALPQLMIYICGPGEQRARAAALELLNAGASALLNWGTAGALAPHLAPGALVLPSAVRVADTTLAVDTRWHTWLCTQLVDLQPARGLLLHSPRALLDPKEKRAAHADCGALAVDMESGAVAEVARTAGVPYAAIRSIVDRQAEVVPASALDGLDEDGEARIGRIIRSLLRGPGELLPLLRLAGGFRRADVTLRAVQRRVHSLYPRAE